MLHIVNGDVACQWLRRSGIDGAYLAWDDVLHEGPVPGDLGLDGLSGVRAAFIASCGWATEFEALTHFRARDGLLRQHARQGGVVIWNSFELYDQLHLLQLLHWFATEGRGLGWPELVFVDDYLGRVDPAGTAALMASRSMAIDAQVQLACEAWQAFTAPEPDTLARLSCRDLSVLPFLAAGLRRLLEEYPGSCGINRTERQVLETARDGVRDPAGLFRVVRSRETPAFMGDTSFWGVLERLTLGPCPLLAVTGGTFRRPGLGMAGDDFFALRLAPTRAAFEVLDGERDWLDEQAIDRWIGGVHLEASNDWRYDPRSRRCERPGR